MSTVAAVLQALAAEARDLRRGFDARGDDPRGRGREDEVARLHRFLLVLLPAILAERAAHVALLAVVAHGVVLVVLVVLVLVLLVGRVLVSLVLLVLLVLARGRRERALRARRCGPPLLAGRILARGLGQEAFRPGAGALPGARRRFRGPRAKAVLLVLARGRRERALRARRRAPPLLRRSGRLPPRRRALARRRARRRVRHLRVAVAGAGVAVVVVARAARVELFAGQRRGERGLDVGVVVVAQLADGAPRVDGARPRRHRERRPRGGLEAPHGRGARGRRLVARDEAADRGGVPREAARLGVEQQHGALVQGARLAHGARQERADVVARDRRHDERAVGVAVDVADDRGRGYAGAVAAHERGRVNRRGERDGLAQVDDPRLALHLAELAVDQRCHLRRRGAQRHGRVGPAHAAAGDAERLPLRAISHLVPLEDQWCIEVHLRRRDVRLLKRRTAP